MRRSGSPWITFQTSYIIRALRKLGAYTTQGEAYSVDDLLTRFGIVPTYRKLLSLWLGELRREGYLEKHDDKFVSPAPLPDPPLTSQLGEAKAIFADIPFLLEYVERCGDSLSDVITGKRSPLDTLFAGGSSATAENIYRHWALSRYFNDIMRSIIGSLVGQTPPNRTIRILEVGAGTGSTSASLLPDLPADRTSYMFTDVSEVFLGKAKREFVEYPFVRYGLLDIERSPVDQGYTSHSFDAIVAANVLHATSDLERTLQNVLYLLAPGGLLLLFETTRHLPYFGISFALIEGWQKFEDNWRRETPLLSAAGWRDILRAQGFSNIALFPRGQFPGGDPTQSCCAGSGPVRRYRLQEHSYQLNEKRRSSP